MKKTTTSIASAFCLLVLLSGWVSAQEETPERIIGSGVSKSETRSVGDFHGVLVQGGAKLEIVVGKTQELNIMVDDNLIEFVTTQVEDGQLTIGWKPKTRISTNIGLSVVLQVPELTQLSIEGASEATIKDVAGSNFSINVDGSGSVAASGEVESVTVVINGAAELDLENLASQTATVTIAGSGEVSVDASKSLVVSIAGSGNVSYVGEPKVMKSVAGSGNVSRK